MNDFETGEQADGSIFAPGELPGDQDSRANLRPEAFDDYPGQERAKENLKVYVSAAKNRGDALDHVLLHGPPGLGKTTLAKIVAAELGVPFYQTSGPAVERPGDLAGLLAGVEPLSVVFIDEIHRLNIVVEEILYSAMEDFCIDILVGQGPSSRTVKVPVAPFTLIGATTKMSLLSSPLRSRFGVQERLEFYTPESLVEILKRSASLWQIHLDDHGAYELAKRSRGTPRIANRLLRRARDFALHHGSERVDESTVSITLDRLDIDEAGLEKMDRLILTTLRDRYKGGPVGLEALAVTVGEERSTLEEVYEPFLMHQGFIKRGPRGREMDDKGYEHLGRTAF